MKFLNSKQKRAVVEGLRETYGITELNYSLIEAGKKRIRAFSGNLAGDEILRLGEFTNIEVIGMYLISQKDDDFRLNFDAVSLLRNEITKGIVEISREQAERWMRGQDIDFECPRGIVVLKFGEELMGVGKSNGVKIFNYVPKERKLKTALPQGLSD
jgi:NOL1/NOP2/fmu family ribosome biogenesis protein